MRITNTFCIVVLAFLQGCGSSAPISDQSTRPLVRKDQTSVWRFDGAHGSIPKGWRVAETRSNGTPALWRIVADPHAPSPPNVLKLVETKNDNGTFNLLIAKNTAFQDLDLSVAVQANLGEEDQGGGPIWRCRDERNYYICRLNPLESNFRVYRVVRGRRKQLKSAHIDLAAGRWYAVRVTMIGKNIACYLDGKKLLETSDRSFSEAGMVGLWTKADAVTSFDDLEVTNIHVLDTP